MNHTAARRQNRREMFRSTLRYLALGGISLGSAGLIARAVTSPAQGGCRRWPSCRDCAALAQCTLPQASAAKRGRKR